MSETAVNTTDSPVIEMETPDILAGITGSELDAIVEEVVDEKKNPFEGEIYYVQGKKPAYYIRDPEEDSWIMRDEQGLKRWMDSHGIRSRRLKGEIQSPADRVINIIQTKNAIDWAGEVAGHTKGIHQVEKKTILVLDEPEYISPQETPFITIMKVLMSMFQEDGDSVQFQTLLFWLSYAVKSLYGGNFAPGQALVLVGPRNAMKTFTVTHIISKLLGGRIGKPIENMLGSTRFNDDLLASELLLIDDEVYSPSPRNRKKFGSSIKKVTANEGMRCEKKFSDPIWLIPFWRLIICVNDEHENVAVLPPLDPSMEDKVIMLKVSECEPPMPTNTPEEREAFRNQIYSELPGFLHFLLNLDIPAEAQGGRFGIKPYHHPDIIEILHGLQPETKLLQIMIEALCKTRQESRIHTYRSESITFDGEAVEGKANDLESHVRALLTSPSLSRDFNDLMSYSSAFGVLIERLSRKFPGAVQRLPGRRGWRIDKSVLKDCL